MTTTSTTKERPARQTATPIALLGGPTSPEANALVDHVLHDHILPARLASVPEDQRQPPRPSSLAKMRQALGAFLADLLELHADAKPGREAAAGMHGSSPKDFSVRRHGFGRSIFMDLTGHLEAAGLLVVTRGKPRWLTAFDAFVVRGGDMTTYRLTPVALALVEQHSVRISDWTLHWRLMGDQRLRVPADTPVLALRKTRKRVRGQKQDAEDMPFDPRDPQAQAITAGIEVLNGFLAKQDIGGIAFLGLRRIFSNGEQPNYSWNKGGRFYSLPGGHRYENRAAEWRRSVITINGEAVDEVDLRASHLTLIHALLQRPFDPRQDPYTISDWPRSVVKLWVSQALGAGNPKPIQWSTDARSDFEEEYPGRWLEDQFTIRDVGADIKARHPLLIDLQDCGIGTHDLMFHEAEILRLAMEDLMLTQGIAVLPVHDAIIAPRSALRQAEEALKRAFSSHVGSVTGHPSMVIPKVTYKGVEA